MPKRAATSPSVPDDALARHLALQKDWLAGGVPSGLRGLDAVVVGEIDWADLDEEWRLRAISAKAEVDAKAGRSRLVAELRAERGADPQSTEVRSVVLAELPLLRPDGTIATSDTAMPAEWSMVRADGPWPGFSGPSTFGVLERWSAHPLLFQKRPKGVVVRIGRDSVPLAEVVRALSAEEVNPYARDANYVVRRLRALDFSASGLVRWSRFTGGAASNAPPSAAEVIDVVSDHFLAARRKKVAPVLDGDAPDWRLLPHVERLERQLVIALTRLGTSWTMRGKKAGVSGEEIFRVLARDGGTFDEAAAKLRAEMEDVSVFDVFASTAGRITTSLLEGLARPAAEGWSTG